MEVQIDSNNNAEKTVKKHHKGAWVAPCILCGIGLLGLMGTYGLTEWLLKLWPASLIVLGVIILIKRSKKDKENE